MGARAPRGCESIKISLTVGTLQLGSFISSRSLFLFHFSLNIMQTEEQKQGRPPDTLLRSRLSPHKGDNPLQGGSLCFEAECPGRSVLCTYNIHSMHWTLYN